MKNKRLGDSSRPHPFWAHPRFTDLILNLAVLGGVDLWSALPARSGATCHAERHHQRTFGFPQVRPPHSISRQTSSCPLKSTKRGCTHPFWAHPRFTDIILNLAVLGGVDLWSALPARSGATCHAERHHQRTFGFPQVRPPHSISRQTSSCPLKSTKQGCTHPFSNPDFDLENHAPLEHDAHSLNKDLNREP